MAPAKQKPPAELTNPIATTADGLDITRPYVAEIEQPIDPRLMQSVDWGIYEKIRKDDQVKSCLEQRIRAVVSAEWDVVPGDEEDPRSIEAADALKNNLSRLGWDRVTKKMLYAPFHGIAVAECTLEQFDGRWDFSAIHVRNARRFRFGKDRELRLLTHSKPNGIVMPEKKFWVVTEGGTDDDVIYGEGLAGELYWPTYFKRNGIRFWNIFLDKFGSPTAKATYKRGTPQQDVDKVVQLLRSLSTDSGIAVPEGIAIDLLQASRGGTADYKELCSYMDAAISKIILSQTMTTDNGSSQSQATVHADVKLDIVKADADLLSDSFNVGPARWWTDWNYGEQVASPLLIRRVEEEADLKVLAETDVILSDTGWVRTDESFKNTYGDGYERKPLDAPQNSAQTASAKQNTDTALPVTQNDNPPNDVKKIAFAEDNQPAEVDKIDMVVSEMIASQGWKPLSPQLRSIIDAIENSDNIIELDAALLQSLSNDDEALLQSVIARAGFALRLEAETDTVSSQDI